MNHLLQTTYKDIWNLESKEFILENKLQESQEEKFLNKEGIYNIKIKDINWFVVIFLLVILWFILYWLFKESVIFISNNEDTIGGFFYIFIFCYLPFVFYSLFQNK